MKEAIGLYLGALLFCGACQKTTSLTDNSESELNKSTFNGDYNPVIDPANFKNSTVFTNKYFPFEIGRKYTYEGVSDEGLEHNEVVRLPGVKKILDVDCIIVSDKVWTDGVLTESTIDWYAQDNEGNVWYFGENVNSLQPDGSISKEGSFEAGIDGAKPGIIMLADPHSGDKYRQEFYLGHAEDNAKVEQTGINVSIDFGDFTNCIRTKEWSPLELGIVAYKFYAPGKGVIKEEEKKFTSTLVKIEG